MKRKVILSLFILFVIFTTGATIAALYITRTTHELNELITLHQVENLRRNLVINIQSVQSDLYTYNTPLEQDFDAIVDRGIKLKHEMKKCTSCHHAPDIIGRINVLRSMVKEYETSLSFYITASSDSKYIDSLKSKAAEIGNALLALSENMSLSASKKLGEMTNRATTRINKVKAILFFTVLTACLLSIFVALHFKKSITRPINELVEATRVIASGNLEYRISIDDKTEFGELARHFNSMNDALKRGYEDLRVTNKQLRREITEHRHTEEALIKSERFLNTIFESILDPFCIIDSDFKIVRVNQAYAEMKSKSSDDLIGQHCYKVLQNQTGICDDCVLQKSFLSADPCAKEKRLTSPDGTIRWVEIYTYPILNEERMVSHVIEYTRDISERKRFEKESLKSQKLESLAILAGGIAHDFNNLLTAIIGNLSIAKLYASPSDKIFERLLAAEKASLRSRDLTQQLLTFSKGGEPIKKIVSIGSLIKETADFALRGSNVNCECLIPGGLWNVEVDEGQVSQVINNLIINANHAMLEGGTINVRSENVTLENHEVRPLKEGKYVKISITDQGIGIPDEFLTKIFDPYFTTKKRGVGLGLATSYSIIKKHHGQITVESKTGVGTTFDIYLPATQSEPQTEVSHHEGITVGKGKILVMDDEEIVKETTAEMLHSIGYHVECAGSGEEAIEVYRKAKTSGQPFDAIIMDLTIPGGMGGKEAIQKLLEIDSAAKAIVSSGYYNDPIMADYRKYGFTGVVTKPYKLKNLSDIVHKVISMKTANCKGHSDSRSQHKGKTSI